jgi:hypothetical protein
MKKTVHTKISVAVLSLGIIFASLLGATNAFAANGVSGYCASGVPDTITGGVNTTYKFADLVKFVACFLQQTIVPLLFAAAIGVFVFGMVKFIGTQESSERESGKQFMLWGIIALAVMFSVWGLVSLLGDTFGIRNVIPQLPVN